METLMMQEEKIEQLAGVKVKFWSIDEQNAVEIYAPDETFSRTYLWKNGKLELSQQAKNEINEGYGQFFEIADLGIYFKDPQAITTAVQHAFQTGNFF